MAEMSSKDRLLPSLLDRLLDNRPEAREPLRQTLEELQDSVKNDLERMLNTRRRCDSWLSQLTFVQTSLAGYGLPDFTAFNLSSDRGRDQFRRQLETAVRCFEPRLGSIKVELLDNDETIDRTVRFRIHALLHAEPAPEAVMFDSSVEPVTCSFKLER
jgi:type VI secretion system protein ImpF